MEPNYLPKGDAPTICQSGDFQILDQVLLLSPALSLSLFLSFSAPHSVSRPQEMLHPSPPPTPDTHATIPWLKPRDHGKSPAGCSLTALRWGWGGQASGCMGALGSGGMKPRAPVLGSWIAGSSWPRNEVLK